MPVDPCLHFCCESGALIRGDTSVQQLTLVFTGDEFADGGSHILSVLKRQEVPGSFFSLVIFTGINALDH